MCSIVAIHINELNTVVFMVYRLPPNNKNKYHGEILTESFKKIVIDNIHKVMGRYEAPMPDIILTSYFNFPRASWNAGIGSVNPDGKYNNISLQQLINVASDLNLLQKVTEGTRTTRNGDDSVLELIFTNNHNLISNIYIQPSELSDHKYIRCETSHTLPTHDEKQVPIQETNLSSYNYETANWKNIKTRLIQVKWNEILEKCDSSEKKIIKIIEIVMKIIENNTFTFKIPRGSQTNKIPRDRNTL